ncbi:MAG: hypothetical protein C4308_05505 [Chitinophagaceae bacterium]
MKWIGLLVTLALIIACFFPWVYIETKSLTLTGIHTEGTNFGKPGYFHFFLAAFFILFHFTPRLWAKRLNLLVTALNLAWAVRNYFLISSCQAGECPEKKWALYIVLASSVLMLVAALLPDVQLTSKGKEKSQL